MRLQDLHTLAAIVEHGSLRAAARRLGLPQPALTRAVRALERTVGAPLFVRSTRGMSLTAAGERLHARARLILAELRRAQDDIAQLGDMASGRVVAALSIMPHLTLLPAALPAFRRRYPAVQLQVIEGLFPDVEAPLRDGGIDFYLGAAPRQPPAAGLAVQHLFDNQRAVVCRRGHPLAGSRRLTELAAADWAVTAVDYDAEQDLAALFHSRGLAAPAVRYRASTALSMVVALMHTDLMAMLPRQWQHFALTRDALQTVPLVEPLPAPAIVLIRRPELPLTPAAEHLSDLLLRHGPGAGTMPA